MKLNVKYDINVACRIILKETLVALEIPYESIRLGEVELVGDVSTEKLAHLNIALSKYGIEILDNQKNILIQKTKDAIIELVYREEGMPAVKISSYLSDKMNYSYSYLSSLFSEVTYTSIENFIILQKIERAKQLIIREDLTLTEISHLLSYSSVAYLSNQFKKTTGLSPTSFQAIVRKRRKNEKS